MCKEPRIGVAGRIGAAEQAPVVVDGGAWCGKACAHGDWTRAGSIKARRALCTLRGRLAGSVRQPNGFTYSVHITPAQDCSAWQGVGV